MRTYLCHGKWNNAPLESSIPIDAVSSDAAAVAFLTKVGGGKASMDISITHTEEIGPPEITIERRYRSIYGDLYMCKPNWSPIRRVMSFRKSSKAADEGICQEIW